MGQWRPWVPARGHSCSSRSPTPSLVPSAGSPHTSTPPILSRALQVPGTTFPCPKVGHQSPGTQIHSCLPRLLFIFLQEPEVLFLRIPEWALEPCGLRLPSIVRSLDFGAWLQPLVTTWPWIHYLTPLFTYVIIYKMDVTLILLSQRVDWIMDIDKTLRWVPGTRSGLNSMSYSSGAETSLGFWLLFPLLSSISTLPSPSITGERAPGK